MRFFPSATRRRLVASSVASTLAVGALAYPLAYAVDGNLKDKQRQVQREIRSARGEVEESSRRLSRAAEALEAAHARLAEARGELTRLQGQLAVAERIDDQMQARLADAQARLAKAQEAVKQGRQDVAAQRGKLADTIVESYQTGDPELLALTGYLSAQTPADLTRKQEASETLVDKEEGAFDDLRAAQVLLRVHQEQVAEIEKEVAAQRAQAAAHLETVEALTMQAAAAQAAVQGLVRERRTARQQARAARQADLVELRVLRQQEERIKRQILAAAAKQRRTVFRGDAGSFLLAPVAGGYVTSPFGYRKHPIYGYWGLHDGVDYGAGQCGVPLRASASGTVFSTYYSSVYGRRLYLNIGNVNGKNLTLVYNHLASYRVRPGTRVQRGQVVGYIGDSGWSTGCHLHFTVLRNGEPVNPMQYL